MRNNSFGTLFRMDGIHPGRHSLIVNEGLNWIIFHVWSVGAFSHLKQTEHMADQSVNATVHYSF